MSEFYPPKNILHNLKNVFGVIFLFIFNIQDETEEDPALYDGLNNILQDQEDEDDVETIYDEEQAEMSKMIKENSECCFHYT